MVRPHGPYTRSERREETNPRETGGEIWAYANSRLAHVGTMTFEGDLAGTFKELG